MYLIQFTFSRYTTPKHQGFMNLIKKVTSKTFIMLETICISNKVFFTLLKNPDKHVSTKLLSSKAVFKVSKCF